jgi:hypothetical protein
MQMGLLLSKSKTGGCTMGRRKMLESKKEKFLGNVQTTFQGNLARKLMVCCFIAFALMGLISVAFADAPPPGWRQVNQNGFGYGPTSSGTFLFVFDDRLFAYNDHGWFRMENPVTKTWTQLTPPNPPNGPGSLAVLRPFGDYLYAWNSGQLWWIAKGADPNGFNWNKVTSTGLPGGVSPRPTTLFNGKIYGVYTTNSYGNFEIWRTGDVAKTAATWEKVVANSFGDPTNNTGVDIMIVFNNKIYAGTTTLHGIFGNPNDYGTGVEIWESPTGNLGTWTQVNTDGFGTKFPGCLPPSGPCNFAIHQVIGSAGVYQLPGQTHDYLYIGTKSHYGGELWRYDGNGTVGWTNVTPPWAGPCQIGCGPARMDAMALFQDHIYLAEGYPTANLAKYDGTNWSVVVNGPTPFDPQNGGLASLAIFEDKLYVGTLHEPGATQGDQIWAFPFYTPSLAASFGSGLWLYRDGAWSKISSLIPNHMTSYPGKLIANFPLFGLYLYNGTLWTQLTTNTGVEDLLGVSNGFYADYGNGLWRYSGAWTMITIFSPNKMASNGNKLLANFPFLGLLEYNDATAAWAWLSTYDGVEAMLGVSNKAYGDFGSNGLWKYDGVWTNIAPVDANHIKAYNGKLVANFPGFGLFEYDGSNWASWLTNYDGIQDMIGVSNTLYADFGGFGLWKYSAGVWTGIAPIHANLLGSYGKKLVANFAGFGLFEYDGTNWTWLTANDGVMNVVGVDLP